MKFFVIVLVLFISLFHETHAQPASAKSIYVIFDASGSMWGKLPDESFKIHTARQVLEKFIAQDFENTEIAFRSYGHRREGDCSDTELVIPFGQSDKIEKPLRSFLTDVNPKGKTPIHRSLTAALDDFGDRTGDIVLITDGIETCNADPCALMREWREKEIEINVHVVGFGLAQKEKDALACISKEAGTPFYEADSASDLAAQLQSIKEVSVQDVAFRLRGVDSAGNLLRIRGHLTAADGTRHEVESHMRHLIPPGDYTLQAGVETRNGGLYQPAISSVSIAPAGETVETLNIAVPPQVHVSYTENGKPVNIESTVSVFQNDEEIFSFRSVDIVYVDEGTYEFHSSPNADNSIKITESVAAGEVKSVVFDLKQTVQVKVQMFASEGNALFREHVGLYQQGEEKYKVHVTNGALILPGTYTARMETSLQSYEQEIVVTDEEKQEIKITVPVGQAVVRYQTTDGRPDSPDRCFVRRADAKRSVYWNSDEEKPLRPGLYVVDGWSNKGEYEPVTFVVNEGELTEVVLQAKK